MSEKTLWVWLKKGLTQLGHKGDRLEKCNRKGVPDCIVRVGDFCEFVELKDWSGSKKHPLSADQKNFLDDYGGVVLVKTKKGIFLLRSLPYDLTPLLVSDVNYVETEGTLLAKDYTNFNYHMTKGK